MMQITTTKCKDSNNVSMLSLLWSNMPMAYTATLFFYKLKNWDIDTNL